MIRTRVGYAGGTTPDPTYRNIGDHTESIQVDYDPAEISFAQLVDVVWKSHDPCARAWSTQYKSIVFYHDDAQKRVAEKSADEVAKRLKRPVRTEIRRFVRFYRAEDYHQKYGLRRRPRLTADLAAIYGTGKAFVDSTAAARVNAHLGGHLTYAELGKELAALGLRAVGEKRLERIEKARPKEKAKKAAGRTGG